MTLPHELKRIRLNLARSKEFPSGSERHGYEFVAPVGPIVDRTKENLVSTDNGIIMARHRLIHAAKALAAKGASPPGVDLAHQRVRSASVILPPDRVFEDAAREALMVRPGTAPASV
jgi:hypothetical protein